MTEVNPVMTRFTLPLGVITETLPSFCLPVPASVTQIVHEGKVLSEKK
jgi:hypothetical protein